MDSRNNFPMFFNKIWLIIALFILLFLAFSMYIHSEKLINESNNERLTSYQLVNHFRQTSDDLTRMARTYVATGDLLYKKSFLEILDIRDGRKPIPRGYFGVYWDLLLVDQADQTEKEPAVPLLELMRQSGFTEKELEKMTEAKIRSDKLADLELEVMGLSESGDSDTEADKTKASSMLYDKNYHQAKALIMKPISEVYDLVNARTLKAVDDRKYNAIIFRVILIIVAFLIIGALWRFYSTLRRTLGGTADEIHELMLEIGSGNFTAAIEVKPSMKNSVLSHLIEMQNRLRATEIKREKSVDELRLAAAFFSSQEAIMITDTDNRIVQVNQAFADITGYTADEAIGQTPHLLQSGKHDKKFYQGMWQTIQLTGRWQGEVWDRRKNGEIYPAWLTVSVIRDNGGAITHYIAMHSDITTHKQAEDKIRMLAFFDHLTNLPNRRLLLDRLKQAMMASSRSQKYGALLFIDLDNFKTLNDTLGHAMGDVLLKQVAQRMTTCIRTEDTVARLGGDEFVVMLVNLSLNKEEAAIQTEVVGKKILTTLKKPYDLNDIPYHITCSIGATLFNDHLITIDSLMKQADLAMYKSKEKGRNTLNFFDSDMETHALRRAALEKDLRESIYKKQFLLHYQAQVNGKNQLIGAEVLVRWQHPEYGLVPPAKFIQLAEETELILPLGRWIIETVCAQLVAWSSVPEMSQLVISVNVSAKQFHQDDFVDQILSVFKETGANPHRMKLELTESLLVSNLEEISEKMSALKAVGIGFSLDDFGTGYSSLTYLKRLPLDLLKIDQSFVQDVINDPYDASIAKTIIVLAKNLGLNVIAEGVENQSQLNFLSDAGCDNYQGYFFSRPLSTEDFEKYVKQFC